MVGDIAHICNRGIEKRKVFCDDSDYHRFVSNLYLSNNKQGKLRVERNDIFDNPGFLPKRDKLVEILKWTLMPNHYHLLLYEVVEGGIVEFTKRIGNSYTKYFNNKNEGRSGYLFQNSAKIVPIENNRQLLYIPVYIDLNILDLFYPNWQSNPLLDEATMVNFLTSYKWSSAADYSRETPFEIIIDKGTFYNIFDTNQKQYQEELLSFIREPIKTEPSTWQVDG